VSIARTLRAAVLGLTVGALVAGGLALAPAAGAASPDVVINEVYGGGGNSGATLKNDFIELKNVGSMPVDVTGWSLQYASATGVYGTNKTSLSGVIAPGATYLVQEAAGTGGTEALPTPDATGNIAMGAAAGKVALARTTATLGCGTACAGTAEVVDLIGYGTTAVGGEGAPTANLSSSTSASRKNTTDTDDNAADFAVGSPSPQSSASGGGTGGGDTTPATLACDSTTVPVGSVQGTTDTSPAVGQTVVVRGTVVGDLQNGGYNGVHVQDPGDGNDATSDAVFVFSATLPALDLGDVVTVRGKVAEFNGLTELTAPTVVTCGTAPLPAPAALALPSTTEQREALEGMLVAPASDLTVTEVYNLNRFGEVVLAAGGRLISPTEAADPGAASAQVAAENAARSIVLDDGSNKNLATANPVLPPPYLTVGDPVRVGDTPQLQPQVLSYGFNLWRLQPADGSADGNTFAATNPRPTAPAAVGGDLRIADFNVLNYFVDFPSEFGDRARGAADAAELKEQQDKIVSAITTLDADVITLHEIENSAVMTPSDPYRAVETLLAAIEAADGHDWDYVRAHEDTDVITNAIVFRTDRVTTVGDPSVPDDLTAFSNARSPIAQTFRAGDEKFSIIANHLKSKGSSCGAASDDTSVGGAGNCNGDRDAQAQALVAFAETVKQQSGDDDVLLTGDFNSYRYEDPIDAVTGAGYTDMGPALADGQYSYVFDGGSGSLDHVFASPSITSKLAGLAVWDINAVESFAYEYDGYEGLYAPNAYRASDHNPTVFGLTTDVAAAATISEPQPLRGDKVTVTGTAFDAGTTVQATLPSRNGTVLGTGVADQNGTVTITFTVPVLLAQGAYPVDLTAADGEKASTSFTLRSVWQDAVAHLVRLLTTGR
jgi:predicted extracellular nuclease